MSRTMWVLPVLVALLVVLGSGAGFASMPSLLGGTGIVSVPDAMVAPLGQVQTALTYQRLETLQHSAQALDMYNAGASGSKQGALMLKHTAGALDVYNPGAFDYSENFAEQTNYLWGVQALGGIANGAELWAAYSQEQSDSNLKTWSVGGKYQITPPKSTVNVAVGASYRDATGDYTVLTLVSPEDPLLTDTLGRSAKGTDVDAYLVATADLSSFAQPQGTTMGGRLLGSAGLLYKKVQFNVDSTDMISGGRGGRSADLLH